MKLLSPEKFAQARHFIKTEARAVDRALFEFRFESAPAETVAAALSAYQNPDGGFGHALEPDMWAPDSSALATAIGLEVLKELDYPAEHPMVQAALRYLLDTFDPGTGVWRIVPPTANDHPHAPWWHDENGSLARTFDGFFLNPRARLLALLYHYSPAVPGAAVPGASWLNDLTERTVAALETDAQLGSGGGDDLDAVLRLAGVASVPALYRERILTRVRQVAPHVISRDPAQWHTYTLRPLKIVHTPDSPIADLIWDTIQADLDYQIDHQSPAGTWDPVWSWFGLYPDQWERACHLWRGHLTLETLTTLRAFGRLPNI